MRVEEDRDMRQLMEETLRTARGAKRSADHSRHMLFWLHLMTWLRAIVGLTVLAALAYGGFWIYHAVKDFVKQTPTQTIFEQK